MEAAMQVASNLLPDDRREIEEGHGIDPIEALTIAAHRSSYVYFTMPNGKTAGLAGVDDDGLIWMVCTPVILESTHMHLLEELNNMFKVEKNLYYGTLLINVIRFI